MPNPNPNPNTPGGINQGGIDRGKTHQLGNWSGKLQNTNERLDKISNEILEITKSLEFTQGKLDEELAIVN